MHYYRIRDYRTQTEKVALSHIVILMTQQTQLLY